MVLKEEANRETKLKDLVIEFNATINGCLDVTRQIDERVTRIGFIPDPQPTEEAGESSKPNNFVEEMIGQLNRLKKNNERMGRIADKLFELI